MSEENANFDSEEYTVGWVCALPLEMAAARGMLDQIHPDLPQQDPEDHNSYILGEVSGHKIVIACLPAGNYGTNSAATVANNLLRTFKSIRFGLMVGIGGGAPSPQHDIRLGDVVISQPSETLGGVVQHDRGKILPRGEFQRTGSHNAPPQFLLTALARLQATHMTEESRVPEFLAQLVAKSPKRQKGKFSYQGALHDRLYQSDYDHVKPENATCGECDESKTVKRNDRDDTEPYFHYGIIASGNQVVKDGRTRERLGREYGALCFEMEAAGLHDFPCLVIRGICDYADSHKNKVWQDYAAATAAAFAKELLLFISPKQVLQEKKLLSKLVSVSKDHLETARQSLDEHKHIRQILENKPVDLYTVHNARYDSEDVKGSPRCEPGTRVRILELISQWADHISGEPLFWLSGPAGTGKSTIARTIIEYFDRDKRLAAGYMFKRGEQDRNDTNRLFSTLAVQLADTVSSFRPSLLRSLEGLDRDSVEKSSLETQFQKLLWCPLETFQANKEDHSQRIIIIDALDECERPEHLSRLLELLSRLCTIPAIHLRVLITSRPAPDITQAFQPHRQRKAVRTLELHREFSGDTRIDIRNFLRSRLEDIRTTMWVQRHPWPTTEELDRLVQLSTTPEPLFIYAATLCRFVSDEQSPRGPTKQLSVWLEQGNKPQINQIYTPILDQTFFGVVDQEFRQKLHFLGAIVLVARPLSAKSLAIILAMDLDDVSWWTRKLYAVLHIPSDSDKPIELLHKSFSDFLMSHSESNKYWIDKEEIHADLAKMCIQQMKKGLKQDICNIQKPGTTRRSIDEETIRHNISAELEYACIYWFYHLECSGRSLSNFTYTFLYDHFLHWMEVLTLLGRLTDVTIVLGGLLEMTQICDDIEQEFVGFVKDSKRAISVFGSVIDFAPLQIYGSLLFFSPVASKVRQMFWHQRIPQNGHIEGIKDNWDARIQSFDDVFGHAEQLAFSPDGHLLALALNGTLLDRQKIELRNVFTGTTMLNCDLSGGDITEMAFSHDGHLLASAHFGGNIRILTVTTGQVELISTSQDHDQSILGVVFDPHDRLIMSVSENGRIMCWEKTRKGYEKKASHSDLHGEASGLGSKMLLATFSPCTNLLAFGPTLFTTKVYDLRTGARIIMLNHDSPQRSLTFSSDSRLLASAGDHLLTVWDLETGEKSSSIYTEEYINCTALSPDGRFIASAHMGIIQLWDLKTGNCKATLSDFGARYSIDALTFSPDSLLLASPEQLWDTTLLQGKDDSDDYSTIITTLAWSPDNHLVALASDDKTVQILYAETGTRLWVLMGHTGAVDELLFSSDSQLLATALSDNTLRIWCMSTGALQKTIRGDLGCISSVTYSADGQIVATTSPPDREVKLWKSATGACLRTLDISRELIERTQRLNIIYFVTFSPDGSIVAASTDKYSLVCWDTASGKQLSEIEGSSPINRVVFSPDSQLMALKEPHYILLAQVTASSPSYSFSISTPPSLLTFSSDSKLLISAEININIRDVATGSKVCAFDSQSGDPQALSLSPNDQMIAVASRDRSVRVWNIASKYEQPLTLSHKKVIETLVFSPDGSILAAAAKRNFIWLWDVSSGTQIRKISRPQGDIRNIKFLPDEIAVTVSDSISHRFFNVWDDMALGLHTYRTTISNAEEVTVLPLDVGLAIRKNWITKGSENILWIPKYYRGYGVSTATRRSWVARQSIIFFGSDSGSIIRFEII